MIEIIAWSLAIFSILLTVQSGYSAALMLYAWEDEHKHTQSKAPQTFEQPQKTFTVLLPARHEEAVIQGTIQRVVDLNYPRELIQVLVVIEAGDEGTIAKVNEKLAQLHAHGINNVRLITFTEKPINKPHGLNIGLRASTGDIITIFDAEDEPHPDILNVVNTTVVREGSLVVQCGVQLMNYADRWFSALNVLEYFFWFKSRMHYHAAVGMVPLGGNTVFMNRQLLQQMGGWDQYCLTEDADIGIRLSAARIPIRVIYEDVHVTREETPPTVNQFVKQRTRWNQGFLQVLGKGEWAHLPTWPQRLLALYTLSFSLLQAVTLIYLPISLIMMFTIKLPIAAAMVSSLPLYMMAIQYIISLVGLYEFTSVHHLKPSKLSALWLLVSFMPYQCLLGYGALRACWRQLKGINTWEKTAHIGAHRVGEVAMAEAASIPNAGVVNNFPAMAIATAAPVAANLPVEAFAYDAPTVQVPALANTTNYELDYAVQAPSVMAAADGGLSAMSDTMVFQAQPVPAADGGSDRMEETQVFKLPQFNNHSLVADTIAFDTRALRQQLGDFGAEASNA